MHGHLNVKYDSVLLAALSLFLAGFCSGWIIPQLYHTCYYQISPLLRIVCSIELYKIHNIIIYCLLLTVFSEYTKTGTLLNAVLATVLTS